MASLDSISIAILFAALLVLAGILSSLIALRFGAPLLLIFLLIGMLAGEAGPGGIHFDDVGTTYIVGSVALALILFDGGLRTPLRTFRAVLVPSLTLATAGVLITAALAAPFARYTLGFGWLESFLIGAVVASTDAAAVFLLLHTRGLRLRPRVSGTLEVESGTNDPFAVFLTMMLVQFLLAGDRSWSAVALSFAREALLGGALGYAGGYAAVLSLNRLNLPQGLHAPFVATTAMVVFALAASLHASGFLAVYLAGMVIGNRPTRAHNAVVVFLDAITWLAQIVMFVLLGLLVSPERLLTTLEPAIVVALGLMLVARPAAVFLCLTPFHHPLRERIFISWVGLRGAVAIFLASIPLLVGLPHAQVYFDIAFVVVLVSLVFQGWTIAMAARRLGISLPSTRQLPRRIELDLPGQLAQELVGYSVAANSPYLRRRLIPSWAKPTLVVRDERVLTAAESNAVHEGDYVYLLAPPEKAGALDRFFADRPPAAKPDPRLVADFSVSGDVTLGALAEIYGLQIAPEDANLSLADDFVAHLKGPAKVGDVLPLGLIALVAQEVADGRVKTVGLRLDEAEAGAAVRTAAQRLKAWFGRFSVR